MDESTLKDIKAVLCVISLLESRVSAFKKELDFFQTRKVEILEETTNLEPPTGIKFSEEFNFAERARDSEAKCLSFALKRLDHEVMFLCIETYSLHEGISKQKSFISKVIKQNGKELSKVDKKLSFDEQNIIFCGTVEDDVEREFSLREKDWFQKTANEFAFQKRKELRDDHGIVSANHEKIDEWFERDIDKELLEKLTRCRDDFAHRLNEFSKIQRELHISSPASIEERLVVVNKVLEFYRKKIQPILGYTTSINYQGVRGFKYDSLSRLMQFRKQY